MAEYIHGIDLIYTQGFNDLRQAANNLGLTDLDSDVILAWCKDLIKALHEIHRYRDVETAFENHDRSIMAQFNNIRERFGFNEAGVMELATGTPLLNVDDFALSGSRRDTKIRLAKVIGEISPGNKWSSLVVQEESFISYSKSQVGLQVDPPLSEVERRLYETTIYPSNHSYSPIP